MTVAPERSEEARHANGFTLTELLIAVTILGALAALGVPQFIQYKLRAEQVKAIEDLRTLQTAIQVYQFDNGSLPSSLAGLPNANVLDPWGRPYTYLKIEGNTKAMSQARKDRFLVPINTDYDLYSMGPDGKSAPPLTAKDSEDDVIRANNGGYIGRASDF